MVNFRGTLTGDQFIFTIIVLDFHQVVLEQRPVLKTQELTILEHLSVLNVTCGSVHISDLRVHILNAEIFGVVVSVHPHRRCAIAPREAWMVTRAEFVEFKNHIVKVSSKSPKCDCEFLLLLFKSNQCFVKTRDQLVTPISKHFFKS